MIILGDVITWSWSTPSWNCASEEPWISCEQNLTTTWLVTSFAVGASLEPDTNHQDITHRAAVIAVPARALPKLGHDLFHGGCVCLREIAPLSIITIHLKVQPHGVVHLLLQLRRLELGLIGLVRLDIGDNQLSGTIPSELGALGNLTVFKLEGNSLSGAVPKEVDALGHNLVDIKKVKFGDCDLGDNCLSPAPDVCWVDKQRQCGNTTTA